jgi:hypothetical protein
MPAIALFIMIGLENGFVEENRFLDFDFKTKKRFADKLYK